MCIGNIRGGEKEKGKRRRLPVSQGAQILPILKFDEFEFRQKTELSLL
jgi:hypothetical protein